MKKILLVLVTLFMLTPAHAGAAGPQTIAELEVGYKFQRPRHIKDSLELISDEMMLMIAPEASRFYSVKTQFYDSLAASPGGQELINDLLMKAINGNALIVDQVRNDSEGKPVISVSLSSSAKNSMPTRGVTTSVFKYPEESRMQVVDIYPGRNETYFTYDMAMDELEWIPGDSTAVVLGYECQSASADYHGRRWNVLFTPDIAVSEGPWQLCGLPGLILKAESEGGEYILTATGIREIKEPLLQIPGDPVLEKISRKEFLRMSADIIRDPGIAVGIPNATPPRKIFHDLLETDYHD